MQTKNDLHSYLAVNFNVFLSDDELDEIIDLATNISEDSNKNIIEENATDILLYLNATAGKRFPVSKQNLKFIMARLKEKNPPELLKQIIEIKSFEWKENFAMKKFLRPETLFNPTKFEGYRQEVEDIKDNPEKFKEYVEQRNREIAAKSANNKQSLDSFFD